MLHSLIRKLREQPEQYVSVRGRDFARSRTLSFETVLPLLLITSDGSKQRKTPSTLKGHLVASFYQRPESLVLFYLRILLFPIKLINQVI